MKRLKDTSKCASLQKGKQQKGITSTRETLDVADDIVVFLLLPFNTLHTFF